MDIHEIEYLLRDYFPGHLEGKSLYYYLYQYTTSYDKNLVNYKPVKESINREVVMKLRDLKDGKPSPLDDIPRTGALTVANLNKLNHLPRAHSTTMSSKGMHSARVTA